MNQLVTRGPTCIDKQLHVIWHVTLRCHQTWQLNIHYYASNIDDFPFKQPSMFDGFSSYPR